jgi:hypothetical protein
MRTIEISDAARERYTDARYLIREVSDQDKVKGEAMHRSFWECWEVLMNILMNQHTEEDEGEHENMKGDHKLIIDADFVPGSFTFAFEVNGNVGLHGGMILHGTNVETFSVELTAPPGPHWSIHT